MIKRKMEEGTKGKNGRTVKVKKQKERNNKKDRNEDESTTEKTMSNTTKGKKD